MDQYLIVVRTTAGLQIQPHGKKRKNERIKHSETSSIPAWEGFEAAAMGSTKSNTPTPTHLTYIVIETMSNN